MAITWAWIAGALIGWFWVAPFIKGPIDSLVGQAFSSLRSSGAAFEAPSWEGRTSNLYTPYPATRFYAYPAGRPRKAI
jgi:hypothetical protein